MSQLVGQECTRCGERIKTVHNGTLCTACGCPIHVKCMSPRGSGCGACGTSQEVAIAYRADAEQREERRARDLRLHHRAWGVIYLLGGLVLVAAAVLNLTRGEFAPVFLGWWALVFVGLAALGRGIKHLADSRR